MKKLSRWGKRNPNLSRFIIAISHIIVHLSAIGLGFLLFAFNEVELSGYLLIAIASLYFVLYIFYPKRGEKKAKSRFSYYQRQKTHDFFLVICYSMVLTIGTNNFLVEPQSHNLRPQASARFIVHKTNPNKTTKSPKSSLEAKKKIKKIKKQIRLEIREMKKELDKTNDTAEKGLQFLLVLLIIGLVLFLGYLILALSCNLYCSGQGTLATAVLAFGWGGLLFLGAILINHILKGDKKTKIPDEGDVSLTR